ncbi:MAG: hypothetical protein K1X57_09675 [Gemmataceae bacterium]|nr:hypothetical protein [Gemmataceae bacterium]
MAPFALWLALLPDVERPLPAILPRDASAAVSPLEVVVAPESAGSGLSLDIQPRVFVARGNAGDGELSMRRDGDRQQARTRVGTDWAAVTGQLSIRDPDFVRNDPLRRGPGWATDETVQVPLSDMLFVFGAVDAESKSVEQQQHKWATKTGVGMKFRPWLLDEVVQLRTGPAVRYEDPDHPTRSATPERSELFLEVSTKLPLPVVGPINLNYTGAAIPPVTTNERERIKQDVRFAMPLSQASQFHFGAKWWSEDQPTPTPFIDRAQLYLGVQIKR